MRDDDVEFQLNNHEAHPFHWRFFLLNPQWQRFSSTFSSTTFGWWASGWRSLTLICSSLNLSSFGTFDSFFLSFRKSLLSVIWLIFSSLTVLVAECFWAKTFWAWIKLLLCLLCYAQGWNRLVSAYSLCHLSVVY